MQLDLSNKGSLTGASSRHTSKSHLRTFPRPSPTYHMTSISCRENSIKMALDMFDYFPATLLALPRVAWRLTGGLFVDNNNKWTILNWNRISVIKKNKETIQRLLACCFKSITGKLWTLIFFFFNWNSLEILPFKKKRMDTSAAESLLQNHLYIIKHNSPIIHSTPLKGYCYWETAGFVGETKKTTPYIT